MSDALDRYLNLKESLAIIRLAHGEESPEEMSVLDQMAVAWNALTESDRDALSNRDQ